MKVALVWHGSRELRDNAQLDASRFGPTAEALRASGLEPEPAVYSDEFAEEVRAQLLKVDAVQVWVNPITDDGHNRGKLDSLLREVADSGVLVSAHPETIRRMGTKKVVYDTRRMDWGSDCHLYHSVEEMRAQLPLCLSQGPRVLKQHRGHSGQGVWKVSPTAEPATVIVRHAPRGNSDQQVSLDSWIDGCAPYFVEGPMLDQEFNPRIADGMVRCYLNIDRVGGFGHQEVNALVDGADPGPRLYSPPDDPRFQELKERLEAAWLPEMLSTLDMSANDLPCLWDADFMIRGNGGYMLCEINVSSVYPYPESAMKTLAEALKLRLAAR